MVITIMQKNARALQSHFYVSNSIYVLVCVAEDDAFVIIGESEYRF